MATEPRRASASALSAGDAAADRSGHCQAASCRHRQAGDDRDSSLLAQQPKHAISGLTRPLFSELRVFHAAVGVSPTPVEAVTPAKK